MRKCLSALLVLVLLLSCVPAAHAVDDSREFFFELSVDGSDTKQVMPGDIITVVFNLSRTDSGEAYDMYAMQNEIRYDGTFFRLVEGSALLSSGIHTTELGLRDEYREFYMNFVSMSGGETWPSQRLVGSFQLEVIAQSGVSRITNQDYLVSTADGQDHYQAACQDVTVIVSTSCTVTFESNGGTAVSSQTVQYGETIVPPEDPVREGYRLEGWYTDIDLQNRWDFETGTVQGNMTLYAKWVAGAPAAEPGVGQMQLLLLLLLLGLFFLLLILLLGRKTVDFETGTGEKIKSQKVKKGGCVQCPEQPERPGSTFAGWYADKEGVTPWDFENDKVEESMTLYAKWL